MLNTIDDDNISLKSLDGAYCSICISSLINDISKLSCNHSFHEKCINEWLKLKKSCPLCRTSIIIPNLDVLPPININTRVFSFNPYFGILSFIFIIFNFFSNFYLDFNISQSNNPINKTLINNQTLNISKSNNNYSIFFVFVTDVFYMMMYYYASKFLILYTTQNLCSIATVSICTVFNIVVHLIYILDTFKKYDDTIYEFSKRSKNIFIVSVILYGSSLFLKTVFLIIHIKINN